MESLQRVSSSEPAEMLQEIRLIWKNRQKLLLQVFSLVGNFRKYLIAREGRQCSAVRQTNSIQRDFPKSLASR